MRVPHCACLTGGDCTLPTVETADRWASWLQDRRYGGDPDWRAKTLAGLEPVRDRLIELAAIEPGGTVLDVGAGEGMIGFAATAR